MATHARPHEAAGKTVKIKQSVSDPELSGKEYHVEDWWDRVAGKSWMFCDGNPACLKYAIRTGLASGIPINDEVLYGKVGPFGHLVHVSEIEV